jgi:hypothetical protein
MPPFLGLMGSFAFLDRNMLDGSARKREGPKVPPDPQSMPTQEQCFAKRQMYRCIVASCAVSEPATLAMKEPRMKAQRFTAARSSRDKLERRYTFQP